MPLAKGVESGRRSAIARRSMYARNKFETQNRYTTSSSSAAAIMALTSRSPVLALLCCCLFYVHLIQMAWCFLPISKQSIRRFGRILPGPPLLTLTTRICSSNNDMEMVNDGRSPLVAHHVALKTRNITTALQFYSLLDFVVTCKFRAGPARAAWLEPFNKNNNQVATTTRLEIIEVPTYLLNEQVGTRRRALDLMERQDALGYNHLALDVTQQIASQANLSSLADWMDQLNHKSVDSFGKTLRVALPPRQQIIGQCVYELAFLYDADGCLVELLHQQSELTQTLESGWEPWGGEGFIGENNKTSLP